MILDCLRSKKNSEVYFLDSVEKKFMTVFRFEAFTPE